MPFDDSPFQFSAAWFELGVVSAEALSDMRTQLALGDDKHPEHYRWRAFSTFLRSRDHLDPSQAHQLYALGAADPDPSLGESMMAEILRRPDCPEALLDAAVASGRSHLVRVVEKRPTR